MLKLTLCSKLRTDFEVHAHINALHLLRSSRTHGSFSPRPKFSQLPKLSAARPSLGPRQHVPPWTQRLTLLLDGLALLGPLAFGRLLGFRQLPILLPHLGPGPQQVPPLTASEIVWEVERRHVLPVLP